MFATTKRRRPLRPTLWAASTLLLALAAVALAQSVTRLTINGRTASVDVRSIDGRPYVSLRDMARAMGGHLVRSSSGYAIETDSVGGDTEPAGGANEVHGSRGSLGQMLFTGKWRFEAVSLSRSSSYDSQYLPDHQTFSPSGDSEELVVVQCRLKNGQTSAQKAMLSSVHPHNIALTDDRGQSYSPVAFDKRTDSTDEGPKMLPGSQTDFCVLFSVPRGTRLRDLVFSLQNAYEDTPDGGTDVRINLHG